MFVCPVPGQGDSSFLVRRALPQHKLLTFNPGGTRGGGAGIKILR